MERRTSDGAGLCGRKEGGVGLDGVDARAVDVEEGEGVGVGATALDGSWISNGRMEEKGQDSRRKNRGMLMDTQSPHGVTYGRNLPNRVILPNIP